MSDVNLRKMENQLRLDPENLNLRIKLLNSYRQLGLISLNEIGDLATLDDPAATAIFARRPPFGHRTRRLYLVISWVISQDILSTLQSYYIDKVLVLDDQLNQAERLNIIWERIQFLTRTVEQQLEPYLRQRLQKKPTAQIGAAVMAFSDLMENIRAFWFGIDEGPIPSNQHEFLLGCLNYLDAMQRICFAHNSTGRLSLYRFQAILNHLVAVFYDLDIIISRSETPQAAEAEIELKSLELLPKYREKVIKYWLPGYTP